jgi:rRNA maturation protein Nop10
MSKCKICGEFVDWNNPNIHYGGHTCDIERLNKAGATKRFVRSIEEPYMPNAEIPTIVGDRIFMRDPATLKPHCCPVCGGKGIVPNGFYLYPQTEYASTSTAPDTCRSCGGKGYILA